MKFYDGIFLRLVALLLLMAGALLLALNALPYTAFFTGLTAGLLCVELYFAIRSQMLLYDKTLLSMLHSDFSSNVPPQMRKGTYANLYKLYDELRARQYEQASREQVYVSILDSIDTAVLILKKTPHDWVIFSMNDYFSQLFGVPKFRHWRDLRQKLPAFCGEIEKGGFADLKTSVDIRIEGRDLQTYSIQTSHTQAFDQEYYVILLDSIQKVIEKKEKEAWLNLMKVISHELMNSLTPIRSLSQSVHDLMQQEDLDHDDLADVREGLQTIVNRSNHLQFFVENYRKLTMLPTPEKTSTDLNALIAECLKVMKPLFLEASIVVTNEIDVPFAVNVDKRQMEQVIINLLTNALHAVKDKEQRHIFLGSSLEQNRVFLTLSDNGKGIEESIREKIFLPFFTTRKDGAGIGLTLSKNIVEAHGGYLRFTSEPGRTEFVISLLA